MFDISSFTIIGRVGQIKSFDNLTRVSIAANASFKKDGAWIDKVNWNEVIVFDKASRDYVGKFGKGDYVRAEGTIRQNSYKKDGQTIYTTELIVANISRQAVKKPAAAPAEAEMASEAGEDNIPF